MRMKCFSTSLLVGALVWSADVPASAQAPLIVVSGGAGGESLGSAVEGIGDFDADGVADIVAGAPFNSTIAFQAGVARVLSGADGGVLLILAGTFAGGRLGEALALVGDVNGDGFVDLGVGAPAVSPASTAPGSAMVHCGQGGALLYASNGQTPAAAHGAALAGVGDVNQDGRDDFAVGASRDQSAGALAGRVTLFSGASGTALWSVVGAAAGDRAGFAVGGGGDLNGDGVADVAVGSPGRSDQLPYAGIIQLRSGSDGQILRELRGATAMDYVGESLDVRLDLDQDGVSDVMYGARRHSGALTNAGVVRVASGATALLLFSIDGGAAGEEFGTVVRGLGDVDGDGVADFAAAAPFNDANGFGSGVVRVFSGASRAMLFARHGGSPRDLFGSAIAGCGDLDHDGLADIVVGAKRSDVGGVNSGAVAAYSGLCSPNAGYGSGCAGQAGFVPQLTAVGCQQSGAQLSLALDRGRGGSLAVLLMGAGAANVPLGGGCSLLVGPLLPLAIGPLPLSSGGPGQGEFDLTVVAPAGFPPFGLAVQAFVVDAAAPPGFSASNGLLLDFKAG